MEGDGQMLTMKVTELVERLNRACEDLVGEKVGLKGAKFDNIRNLHDEISNRVDPVLVKFGFQYSSAREVIRYFSVKEVLVEKLILFTVKLKIKKDKRHKWELKGLIEEICFITPTPVPDNMTVVELIRSIEKSTVEKKLVQATDGVETLEGRLFLAKAHKERVEKLLLEYNYSSNLEGADSKCL